MILEMLGEALRLAQRGAAAYKGGGPAGQRPGGEAMMCRESRADASSPAEVARFDALGERLVGPRRADGAAAPADSGSHRLGARPHRAPLRARCRSRRCRSRGSKLLDVGCGAGLFAEPLARLGADVLGVDPAPASIAVARRHAEETGARVAYRVATIEEIAAEPRRFDIVSAMEVIEHVAEPARFVADRGLAPEARRPLPRLDPEPHAAELCARDCRRPNMCCAGSSRAPTAGSSSSRRRNSRPPCAPPGLRVDGAAGVAYDPFRRTWRLSRGYERQLHVRRQKAGAAIKRSDDAEARRVSP